VLREVIRRLVPDDADLAAGLVRAAETVDGDPGQQGRGDILDQRGGQVDQAASGVPAQERDGQVDLRTGINA
jgi:hypothetical protein